MELQEEDVRKRKGSRTGEGRKQYLIADRDVWLKGMIVEGGSAIFFFITRVGEVIQGCIRKLRG